MVLTKKRPHAPIQDGKIGSTPFTTVDALDAPGRSGRFLGTPGIVVNVNQVANLPSYPIEYVTQKDTYNEYTISN